MTLIRSSVWFSLVLLVASGCSDDSSSAPPAGSDAGDALGETTIPGNGTDGSPTKSDAEQQPPVSTDASADEAMKPVDASKEPAADSSPDASNASDASNAADASNASDASNTSDASDASTVPVVDAEAGLDSSGTTVDSGADVAQDDVFYVHWCNGDCMFTGGADDRAHHVSSLLTGARTLADATLGTAGRAQLIACLRQQVAGLRISFVESPPAAGPYRELVLGGTSTQAGFQNGTLVVAPFTCGVEKDDTIVFVFANTPGIQAYEFCQVTGMAVGETYGIDHAFHNTDVMSWLTSGPQLRIFADMDVACGEYSARTCCDGKPTENTHALIAAKAGR